MAKRRKKGTHANTKAMKAMTTRRAAGSSPSLPKPPPADFTDVEEEFFRAGLAASVESELGGDSAESFDDLEPAKPRPGLWSRLVGRV